MKKTLFVFIGILYWSISLSQTPLYTDVPVSDVGTGNNIGEANTSRNISVDASGNVYVAFTGSEGIRVAKSTDRGQTFSPSVQITTFNAEAEIAVNNQGIVFVGWLENFSIMLSQSLDQGATFSAPVNIGPAQGSFSNALHISTYADNIYIIDTPGSILYYNNANGVGAFNTHTFNTPFVFSDVISDQNGTLYTPRDNPILDLHQSDDFGQTINQVTLNPANAEVFYSSYTFSDGPCGNFIFVAGSGTLGYKIDVNDGSATQINFQDNSLTSQGRTLYSDNQGTLIDGYRNINGELMMSISSDQGQNFNAPITIATGQSHNISRNTFNNDIVVVYEENGQVFLSVFDDILKSVQIIEPTPPLTLCAGESFDLPFTLTGTFSTSTTFTAVLSDENGDFSNSVDIGSLLINGNTGTITCTLPTGIPDSVNYRVMITSLADCVQSSPITISIGNIEAGMPEDIEVCDIGNGSAVFDLTSNETNIADGQTDYQITYHTSEVDAQNNNSAIVGPENYSSNGETIWARLQSTVSSVCFDVVSFDLILLDLPVVVNQVTLEQCDTNTDGITTFNLTEANQLISTNWQNETFTYYLSQIQAENGLVVDQIANPAAYDNPMPLNSIVFVRVENEDNCYRTAQIDLVVEASQIPPGFELVYNTCDDGINGLNFDGISTFDFSDATAQIVNLFAVGQNLNVTYYTNELDALSELNEIADISNHRNDASPGNQGIWVRVDGETVNDCQGLGIHIQLNVLEVPENNTIEDYTLCSSNGEAIFDLPSKNLEVIGTQTENLFISYHETIEDAQNSIAIADPENFTSTGQTIFVSAFYDNNANGLRDAEECLNYSDMQFDLIVITNPVIFTPDPIEICSDQVNTVYNLTDRETQIIGSDTSISVAYFETQDDVDNNIPIANPSMYLSNQLTRTIIIVASGSNGCPLQTQLNLITTLYDGYNQTPGILEECETDNNGFDFFDLTRIEEVILNLTDADATNNLDASNYTFTYYTNNADAQLIPEDTSLAISNPTSFENTTMTTQGIFVRVTPISGLCPKVIPFTLLVNSAPPINIATEYVICLDANDTVIPPNAPTTLPNTVIDTGLSTAEYSFQWYKGTEQEVIDDPAGTILPGETAPGLLPTESSYYTIVATDLMSGCNISVTTFVHDSYPPQSILISMTNLTFSGNNTLEITVTGNGDYEYNLDNGPWQDSNIFENVLGGERTVYVRDVFNCDMLLATKIIIDYPKFFTPNDDGYKDSWNIRGISTQSNAIIYIFDRYGKLLKQLSPNGNGWNGTYNGRKMPSSDYWFTVEYNEPLDDTKRIFKAHFTLKR